MRNLIPSTKYNQNTFFTMILIKKNKSKKLGPWKIGESITLMNSLTALVVRKKMLFGSYLK